MLAYQEGLKGSDTRMVITPNSEFFRYFGNALGGSEQPAAGQPGNTAAAPPAPTESPPVASDPAPAPTEPPPASSPAPAETPAPAPATP
jgi:membrane protease subunit HflC